MTTLKISWGTRIALLYGGFVLLIITLVTGSMRQNFDLVSKDYYQEELKYQQVIDAGKNQAELSKAVSVKADARTVSIEFPAEFSDKHIQGTVLFYSEVNASWDKSFPLSTADNKMYIPRQDLRQTHYLLKIDWQTDGKKFYQQSEINLSK